MPKTVNFRRWDNEKGGYVENQEIWPTAEFDEVSQQWCLEGHGWRMVFEIPVAEAAAQHICETIANAIQFQI